MELDELFETEEYLQRAVAVGIPFIPRNPDEVVDAVFGGRLYCDSRAWPDSTVEAFCNAPAVFDDEDECEDCVEDRAETGGDWEIDAAGVRFREGRDRHYAIANGQPWNGPIPSEPGLRQNPIQGRRFGQVRRPLYGRLTEYASEIERLRERVTSARFTLEEVYAAMARMPALNLYQAARFLRTSAIQQAQTDWTAGRITEQDYRDAIQAAVDSYNATTRVPSFHEGGEG